MRVTIETAETLARRCMRALGCDAGDAHLVAGHLIDCELRGLSYGGLPRILSIAERLKRTGDRRRPIRFSHETAVSAQVEGGDHLGYVVAHRATRLAIDKASVSGLAIVAANDTWYTGMLSYYAEIAAAAGLVTMIASNASPWVAPYGASEGRFGTNPICFGFPGTGDPVIWDIGTSSIVHAEVTLRGRLGQELPEGVAFDADGQPTRDPAAALAGAFAPWGGAKGSGLGLAVQLLGMLAGSPALPPDLEQFGFIIVAISPNLFGNEHAYRAEVARYGQAVRDARPLVAGAPARMPFDRSAAVRRERLNDGHIDIAPDIHDALERLAGQAPREEAEEAS
jgi:LDH2 family malate/lactate/ureidoglycolate dehydrogenase